MPIMVEWYNHEKTIISSQFIGIWVWDDYLQAVKVVNTLLKSVDYEVGAIDDHRTSDSTPREFTLDTIHHIFAAAPPNLGLVCIVRAPYIIKLLVNAYCQIIPHGCLFPRSSLANIRFTDTIEEAEALMAERYARPGTPDVT